MSHHKKTRCKCGETRVTCSRGEDALDICAECGRVREGDADGPLRCRYEDCTEGHPLAEEDEVSTCPTCRQRPGLALLRAMRAAEDKP